MSDIVVVGQQVLLQGNGVAANSENCCCSVCGLNEVGSGDPTDPEYVGAGPFVIVKKFVSEERCLRFYSTAERFVVEIEGVTILDTNEKGFIGGYQDGKYGYCFKKPETDGFTEVRVTVYALDGVFWNVQIVCDDCDCADCGPEGLACRAQCCNAGESCCSGVCCESNCCSTTSGDRCCAPGEACFPTGIGGFSICCKPQNWCSYLNDCCPDGFECSPTLGCVESQCACPSVNYRLEILSPFPVSSVLQCDATETNCVEDQIGHQCGGPNLVPDAPASPLTQGCTSYNRASLVSNSDGVMTNSEPGWESVSQTSIYGFLRWDVLLGCRVNDGPPPLTGRVEIVIELRALAESGEFGRNPSDQPHVFSIIKAERLGTFYISGGSCGLSNGPNCLGQFGGVIAALDQPVTISPTFDAPNIGNSAIANQTWPYIVDDLSGNTTNTLPCLNGQKDIPFTFRISSFTSANPLP